MKMFLMLLKDICPLFALVILVTSCDHTSSSADTAAKDSVTVVAATPVVTPAKDSISYEMGNRLKLSVDLDGDHIIDTIYESYISQKTGQETFKYIDEKNMDIETARDSINANLPISRIYTNIAGVDTLPLTDHSDHFGIYMLENLGDLNEDGGDEIGYVIDLAGHSNLNEYTIITLTQEKKWKKLLTFHIHEGESLDKENLFDGKSLIKKTAPYTFRYKCYEAAEFEEREFVIDSTK
ncbi:hypothetical protein [Chitinophaga eiseniae]|uniref:Lipoprotein n=1 Tax=Chitinophaga eiseniae TaxID=634771 RepID=A0A847SSS4_9BACT|nr:hypothetical protein [Chitinophaga eiseniae]NLR79302.1 hypothetical protein [Chitinophaga eiseniae]